MDQIGTMYTFQEERKIIEWKILDFLQLESNETYFSPNFAFAGASGYVYIHLHSQNQTAPFEDVDMSLLITSKPEHCTNVTATFSLKTADGKSDLEKTAVLTDKQTKFSILKFISRSDVIEKQSELLPSGTLTLTLTVICTLKNNGPNVMSERKFLDTSAQTDEGTGIWTLQQHLREIWHNGNMSDVILKADGQEFKAHRCILAARSPVLSAMMINKMKKSSITNIEFKNIYPQILSDFLSCLYTGSTECITSENVSKLYFVAFKCQVDVLKKNCLDHMLTNISVENFCDIFWFSVLFNEKKLIETCIQYFGKHLLDIMRTSKWQSLLLERPTICSKLHIKHLELNK